MCGWRSATASLWFWMVFCCCTCRSWDRLITEPLSLSSTLGCIVAKQPEANRSNPGPKSSRLPLPPTPTPENPQRSGNRTVSIFMLLTLKPIYYFRELLKIQKKTTANESVKIQRIKRMQKSWKYTLSGMKNRTVWIVTRFRQDASWLKYDH